MSRIVSVWLPRWPILRFIAGQSRSSAPHVPVDPEQPFVLAVDASGGPRIAALNAAAEREGLMTGDLLADARAKAGGLLQVRSVDPTADHAALRRLALWATCYTPAVSVWGAENGADGLFLDVTGATHLFGGEESLLAALLNRLKRFGLPARLAIADTPGAAWALSHFHRSPTVALPSGQEAAALAPLPIEALRLSPATRTTLRRLGFKRIGALIDNPRAPFAARFPAELLKRLDQAFGRLPEPLAFLAPPPAYHSLRQLLEPISTQEAIIVGATHLMQDIVPGLVRDGVGARSLRLALYRIDGEVVTVDIGLTVPTRSPAHVARLVDLRLERIVETIDAGFGFEALSLTVTVPECMEPRQAELASTGDAIDQAERCAALVDGLRQRLGPNSVRQLKPVASHLPERSEVACAPAETAPSWLAPHADRLRPALLLPRAEPAEVTALVPDGPPRRFLWRGMLHAVTRAQGPERIASEWWRTSTDQTTRDYYVVENDAGRRFWLYREGLYGRETAARAGSCTGCLRDQRHHMTAYAELAVTTNFSFLCGASHPQEMVAAAEALGLAAIGIADRNSFAGVVRAYDEWRKEKAVKLLVGTRLVTTDGCEILTYPTDRQAYGRLCRLLTHGNRKTKSGQKGECRLGFEDILSASEGQILIALPPDTLTPLFSDRLAALARAAPGRSFLAGVHRHRGDEPRRLGLLDELGKRTGTPLVAVNDVFYHTPERRPLADVVTCIREKCTIAEAGFRLAVNAERHLKPPAEMARLFAGFPEAIARTVEIAAACHFSLGDLKNEYPDEPVPAGKTAQQHLQDLAWQGARKRYPDGVPQDISDTLAEELALIAKLDYARYFLTVHDVVAFARNLPVPILCQGRGSAANSVVCYCLGITEVNPAKIKLLFARFISEKRGEPPDIDVDFEHERREEVIQHIYRRYGRDRAAICATVIHYRSRRAIREVGKAMGLTPDVTAALAKTVWGHGDDLPDSHVRQAGLDPSNPAIGQAVALANALTGFPRHLSQHVGGFILTRAQLDETVPVCHAAMDERTFIEWDKDDIDTLHLMKVDVLALGMLSCLRRGLDLLRTHYRIDHSLASILLAETDKGEDARQVYEMLSRADSVGVFQVESRAQMSMLPRLKPEKFYDLVIEVAIVRPGPIQGDMVHPYLRRRDGTDPVYYPSPDPAHGPADELEKVLSRTLGVPLFQEQAMQIAIDAAKFTPDEADGLRRAMATFRHNGNVHLFRDKFMDGMTSRGYARDFAERCFKQIEGFGEYGFPESHAASFALLVYVSAWIKCLYPEVFCAAILNSQPMGFYQAAQLVRDARQHGVEVLEVDVNRSAWDCTLEPASAGSRHRFAVRLGFRQVEGLNKAELGKLVAVRGNGYAGIERLAAVAGVSRFTIERLAEADAFRSLGLDRRAALWAARRLDAIGVKKGAARQDASADADRPLPLLAPHMGDELFPEPEVALPPMQLSEHVAEDYLATGLSLKEHPVTFFRERLTQLGVMRNVDHRSEALPQNRRITVAGLVLTRQMPGAKGVVFMTLEDETDIANIIIWPKVFARNRRVVMTSRLVAVRGRLQRAGLVVHVLADSFIDLSAELARLRDGDLFAEAGPGLQPGQADPPLLKSRDFH